MPRPDPPPNANQITSRTRHRGATQAVYYRDSRGREPVNDWLEALLATKPAAVAKLDDFVEEYLNNRRADDPPPEFRLTSQIDGGLRELRVRFANTRYRLLYQRSGNLVVLLHGLEKNTGALRLPTSGSPRNGSLISGRGWTLSRSSALALPGMMRHRGAGVSGDHWLTLTGTYLL